MIFTPSAWIKICSLRTDFKKINSVAAVLVLSLLLFPTILSACLVTCKSNLSLSLGPSGEATITPLILLQDPSCDPINFTVDITDPNGNSVGNTLTCAHVGLTMTATVTQTNNGNNCSTLIFVSDYISPQIVCSDTTVLCNESVDPSVIGYPTATDNCTVFANTDFTYNDEFMDLACFAVHGSDTITSQIQRTWSVQDESGNENTCIQMIYLKRVTIDDVTFPAHRDGFAAPVLDCSQDPTNLSLSGEPSINGIPVNNTGPCELIVSFTDQIVPLCGPGSYRVLRTWTVIDYCSGDFTLNVQIINVEDNTAPEITCPADLTVGTLQNDCNATVNLFTTTATDDCSNVIITPSWAFGTGYGPFINVPVGTYPVTYTAEDDCGNISTCIMNVTVVDNVPPTLICDYNTAINLSVFGNALVDANIFDDGSYDNCGVTNIAVSRDGINFSSSVYFDCADIQNSPIDVTLKVWDAAGNENECVVTAMISDMINPAISCPSDVYLSCYEDFTDVNLVGAPIVDDNCTIDTIYYFDVIDLNDCNEGTVNRTWTVVDAFGNSSFCSQLITLVDNTPLNVIFPDNYVTSICGDSTSVLITGEPIFINDDCENVSFNHTDEIISTAPSCYRILRTWVVYEWCTYDPNDGTDNGFWTDVQVIDVIDTLAPIITCESDTIIGMYAANCSGANVVLSVPIATDCNTNLNITNDSPYATNNGADASGFYPPGVHTITYTATDGCGNFSTCFRTVSIVDAKLPTPVCPGGINVTIGMNGTVEITPEMIDFGSYDNCTTAQDLVLEVSPQIFTCNDLGDQTVTLTVTDEAGNSAYCTSIVNVQNNDGYCIEPTAMISGHIENENGFPVKLVDLNLSGNVETSVSVDDTGYFEFTELPLAGAYEITPNKDVFDRNGVSTFDLVLMKRHVLGIQPFNSPYKIIAADVNHSGSVSTFDLVKLRRLILEIDTVLTDNTSWRFVSGAYIFPDPANPFLETFPESLIIDQLEADIHNANFVGIKIGDVNGNANPAEFIPDGGGDDRNESEALMFTTPVVEFEQDEIIKVPIFSNGFDNILGYQLTFDFDVEVLDLIGTEAGVLESMSDEHFNFSKKEQGLVSTSWTRGQVKTHDSKKALFILKFKSKKPGKLEKLLRINANWLNTEAYTEEMEILGIDFEFSSEVITEKEQFMLYQNYPNPFLELTKVPFSISNAQEIIFEVIDSKGAVVYRFEKYYESGRHEITLNRSDFRSAGIYFYKINLANGDQLVKSLIAE